MSSTKNTGSSSKVVSYLKENKLLLKPRSEYPTTWSYVKGIIVLVNHWCHKILLTIAQRYS